MQAPDSLSPAATYAADDYFGNTYRTCREQYGVEYLDRNFNSEDEAERVVILGYH